MDSALKTSAQPNQSIRNGFEILEFLALSKKALSTSEISTQLGLHKSVVSRLLLTLNGLGYVSRVGRGVWRTHSGLMALGAFGLRNNPLSHCQALLQELINELDCIVAVGFVWKDKVVYLFHSSQGKEVTGFGKVFPVEESSIGLLLAGPKGAKSRLVQFKDRGNFSLAVPFEFNRFRYGLAVSGPNGNHKVERTVKLLQDYAGRIEALDPEGNFP